MHKLLSIKGYGNELIAQKYFSSLDQTNYLKYEFVFQILASALLSQAKSYLKKYEFAFQILVIGFDLKNGFQGNQF